MFISDFIFHFLILVSFSRFSLPQMVHLICASGFDECTTSFSKNHTKRFRFDFDIPGDLDPYLFVERILYISSQKFNKVVNSESYFFLGFVYDFI